MSVKRNWMSSVITGALAVRRRGRQDGHARGCREVGCVFIAAADEQFANDPPHGRLADEVARTSASSGG